MPSNIPQAAVDIFSRKKNNLPIDVVKEKVVGVAGNPVGLRTAERWHQHWKLGISTSDQETFKEQTTISETDDELVVNTVSSHIKTLPDLITEAKVDLDLWEVETWKAKTYEGLRKKEYKDLYYTEGRASGFIKDEGELAVVTMWAVWAKFRRREEKPLEEVVDRIIARLKTAAPKPRTKLPQPKGKYLFLPAIVDAHVGKRSLSGEYSIQQAAEDYIRVGRALIERALSTKCDISQILFLIGNDAFHMDNRANTTTRGTWLEVSGDYRDVTDALVFVHTELISDLARIAPVRAVDIEGNHDLNSAYWLGKLVEAYFHNWGNVSVDLSRNPRKYCAFGENLIGMTHGDGIKPDKLPLLMAQESAEWSSTSYRVFFRGNWHKKEAMYHPIVSETGVVIETLPALCPTDTWHQMKGYIGNHRMAEARLFHYDNGPAGVWPVFVDEV